MSPRIANFDWDAGNVEHFARHGVTKAEITEALFDHSCFLLSSNYRNGELRYEVVGETESGRLPFLVMIIRKGAIRPVTAFTASRHDAAAYWKARNDAK